MRALVSPKEMFRIDQETMRVLRCSSFDLMERVTDEMLGHIPKGSVLVLCGPGNNGGDGYRLAEKLRRFGRSVNVWPVYSPQSKDCRRAAKLCRAKKTAGLDRSFDVIVDAVFGYNGRSDLDVSLQKILKAANRKKSFRISLDVPTGLDTTTAKLHRDTFYADLTLTVGYGKDVFWREEVMEVLGRVVFIGDYFAKARHFDFSAIEASDFQFREIKRTSHKGSFGKCGIVGGSDSTPGAALLAAEAAYRVGAGYSTVYWARRMKNLSLRIKDASFLHKAKWTWADLQKENALVVGCGGAPSGAVPYQKLSMPVVVDADALSVWKNRQRAGGPCILTPHPGEAARILGVTTSEIQKNRDEALLELVQRTKQSVYLKGAPGLLRFSSEFSSGFSSAISYVNLYANPILAKAGSGDVLSGIMGGFLAQKPKLFCESVVSALVFQQTVAEILRQKRASLSADQLNVFSESFRRLKDL